MTQKEFSELLGITQRAVINYEVSGRIPKKKILKAICEQFKICEQWLLTGEGPIYNHPKGTAGGETGDMPPFFSSADTAQHIENITSEKNKTGDMSPVYAVQRELTEALKKGVEAQERITELTEQLATLRIQLERRDMRIRELEKENAGLREAQKGASRVQNQIFGAGA